MGLSKEEIGLIVDNYYDDVYKFCVSQCRNVDDAMDLTQQTFLILLKKSDHLSNTKIKAWLFQVANNLIKYRVKNKVKKFLKGE